MKRIRISWKVNNHLYCLYRDDLWKTIHSLKLWNNFEKFRKKLKGKK